MGDSSSEDSGGVGDGNTHHSLKNGLKGFSIFEMDESSNIFEEGDRDLASPEHSPGLKFLGFSKNNSRDDSVLSDTIDSPLFHINSPSYASNISINDEMDILREDRDLNKEE